MTYDLIVIGGGSGGLVATMTARKLGATVLLLDKKALGGDCLFAGCVPSKTLIRSAEVAHLARTAARYGLEPCAPPVDGARVMAHVKEVIARIGEGESIEHFERLGATVRIGAPRFVSPTEIELAGGRYRARAFIIATGSRAAVPELEGLAEAGYLTNETVFDIERVPESLAVLGGGPVGCELGQALGRLGAKVTIVQKAERLLPKEEPECSSAVRQSLESEGVAVHTATEVRRVRAGTGGRRLECERSGARFEVVAEHILVAAGRRPNIEGLGLDQAGIEYDRRAISVDEELRTTNPRVFAVGDVNGLFPFTHMAGYQAVIAVRNALLPLASRADYRVVPWTTFTAPEVARVGQTEAEARASGGSAVKVHRARIADVDRAHTEGEESGFVKLVEVGGHLAGAHIVGARAGDIIHVAVLAMKRRLGAAALAKMIYVYPTLSEAVQRAALGRYDDLLSSPRTLRVLGWLRALKAR